MDFGAVMIWVFFGALFVGLIYLAKRSSTKKIICPNANCGYKGEAKKIARGSFIIGIILCLFFILPGLLYFIFKGGYRYVCPKCGMKIDSDN
jgi:hypothetical protein